MWHPFTNGKLRALKIDLGMEIILSSSHIVHSSPSLWRAHVSNLNELVSEGRPGSNSEPESICSFLALWWFHSLSSSPSVSLSLSVSVISFFVPKLV